jgi:hypothetical protein
MLLNTIDDIMVSIDLANAQQLFSDDSKLIKHQEYFAFENTKILLSIHRFDISNISHHTTVLYSDE